MQDSVNKKVNLVMCVASCGTILYLSLNKHAAEDPLMVKQPVVQEY